VEGTFQLVFLVFNTLFALLTQDDQIRCFSNVAQHLMPGGAFVIEAFVPDLARFDRGQRVQATDVGVDELMLEVTKHHADTQRIDGQQLLIHDGKVRSFPVRLRYAFPSELDLMARLGGLRLRERWAGWRREPFDGSSGKHVSVYERPTD
jgi:hypothetical protein